MELHGSLERLLPLIHPIKQTKTIEENYTAC
jgi:hypothetical protein